MCPKILHPNRSLAKIYPDLAEQWHPTKNGSLTPYNISPGSGKHVWWKCAKGEDHEWKSKVYHRSNGSGCPYCGGRKVSKSNNLAKVNPELAKEWHPTKNGDLTPYDVVTGYSKKVWWKCPKGDDHEWTATVIKRKNGRSCPICSGHKVARSTSLGALYPQIAKKWHPTKNNALTPYDVSPGSSKKVWWKCTQGEDHEWQAMINNRTKGSGCSVCANQTVVESNSLSKVNPELAKEWHPNRNGELKPTDVTFGSHKKVWWQCHRGHDHVWKTSPSHRNQGNGCPFCKNPSSTPELRIFSELKSIFKAVEHRVKINGFEVDILIPELKIGIEYDGEFWHRNKQKQDLKKNVELGNIITLIRVRDKGLETLSENDIQQKTSNLTVNTIKSILQQILKLREIESPEVLSRINSYYQNNKWIASELFRKLHAARNHIDFEESIEYLYPEISNEWHPTKNDPLLPKYFLPGSNKKVWWKCTNKEDHEWQSAIVHRCLNNTGCPICSNKKIVNSNCLATLNSKLAKQWHPFKNGKLTPYDVGIGSNKRVWWKCPKGDDHEWRTSVTHRTERGQGCPICSNNKIVYSNSLARLNPKLAEEWHPTKNSNLTPSDVGTGSNKSVWWKCPQGEDHEWKAIIVNRQRGAGCPICANQKVVKSNSLAILDPELAKEWHPTKNDKLTPYHVSLRSGKKVWWKCPKGDDHEWQAIIRNRQGRGDGCTICSNHKVVLSNCLATIYPELAKDWHPTKNGSLTPMDVTSGSNKTVWWLNHVGHEFEAKICDRVRKERNRILPGQLGLFDKS